MRKRADPPAQSLTIPLTRPRCPRKRTQTRYCLTRLHMRDYVRTSRRLLMLENILTAIVWELFPKLHTQAFPKHAVCCKRPQREVRPDIQNTHTHNTYTCKWGSVLVFLLLSQLHTWQQSRQTSMRKLHSHTQPISKLSKYSITFPHSHTHGLQPSGLPNLSDQWCVWTDPFRERGGGENNQ